MSRPTLANFNGQQLPLDQVMVPALDRGFLFGDAIYEALRVYGGQPWLFEKHMARLARNLAELRIVCDVQRLRCRLLDTLSNSGVREGLIYIQVTRGAAERRTHAFPTQPVTPNELLWVSEYAADPYAAFRETGIAAMTYPDVRWGRRDIKSTNLLGNCLACQAAIEAGCQEAILVEEDGSISEGSHTSVFAVMEGKLLTYPESSHILPGITRGLVLELADRAGLPVVSQAARVADLPTLNELFLTGTTAEILAIVRVDGKPIGDGKPGPVTRKLEETYRNAVTEWLENAGCGG